MYRVLLKYNDIKLLVDADCDMQLFVDNKAKIVELNDAAKSFAANILNQTDADIKRIDALKSELSEFVQMTDVIGFPFDMRDAELYALDKKIVYRVIELSDE